MPSSNIRYINQTAPFWDWVASFENSAREHPFFGGPPHPLHPAHPPHPPHPPHHHHGPTPPGHPHGPPPGAWWSPWGRSGNWHGNLPHHGPAPPQPPAQAQGETTEESSGDDTMKGTERNAPDLPEETPQSPQEGCSGRRQHGRCGGRRGHRSGRGFGRHPYGRWGGLPGARGGFNVLNDLFGPGNDTDEDWKPEVDVFDTDHSFVVHVSLPGANKEDIGVNWDSEKSELNIAGVVHRPGNEDFLKALALDERKVGAFDRNVRLGTRAIPAHVDVDGITAKLENGILVVDVPKMNGEFVEIKKVDIE